MPAGCREGARSALCKKANGHCGTEGDDLANRADRACALAALKAASDHFFANFPAVFRECGTAFVLLC